MYIVFTPLVLFDRRVGPSPPSDLNPFKVKLLNDVDQAIEDQISANDRDPVPLISLEKKKKKFGRLEKHPLWRLSLLNWGGSLARSARE